MIAFKTFRKRAVIWTMVITFLLVCGLGLGLGTVVEATLAEEIAKWVLGGLGVSCGTGVIAYLFSPLFYHGDEEYVEEDKPTE